VSVLHALKSWGAPVSVVSLSVMLGVQLALSLS
jgi:hypothetical protein